MIETPRIQLIIPLVNKVPWSQNNCDNTNKELVSFGLNVNYV
jgi:hypothetical protein